MAKRTPGSESPETVERAGDWMARLHCKVCNEMPAGSCRCEYCLLAHATEHCSRHHGAFNWDCTAPPGSG
jgi:hypothetical protein